MSCYPHSGLPVPFDRAIRRNGYIWWYIDAISDDGIHALTLIAFVGSVFSPYYARARRRAGLVGADPENHCAMNICLYERGQKRWSMTERGGGALQRDANELSIGPSSLRWSKCGLSADLNEVTVPLPSRIRGKVQMIPDRVLTQRYTLDECGRHHWHPIAPNLRVIAEFDRPGLSWKGSGYLDSNFGDRPLEDDFRYWNWSRTSLSDGRSAVFYDVVRSNQTFHNLALMFDTDGQAIPISESAIYRMPTTNWGIARSARGDATGEAPQVRLVRTLEDSPFYSRSLLDATVAGERTKAIHETLSLDRFNSPLIQALLPFRMPRRR